MNKDENIEPTIISFLSGKGGSGKTTASLALGKILSDIGFKVLLIDFDLATNGASYFFSPQMARREMKGIIEISDMYNQKNLKESSIDSSMFIDSVINIDTNFDFIPSRSKFGTQLFLNPEMHTKEFLSTRILKPLIAEIGENYNYIIIDNQAGYSYTGAAAANISSKVVIVAEPDRVSSDAIDNLISLIGNDLPRFRRYLYNKVEIKEAGDYHKKVKIYKEINRLPPLPFDFEVRNAFGAREIPIDLNKPTSFLIAMFATVKEIIPENRDLFEKYENEKVTILFDRYQNELDILLKERKYLQKEILQYQTSKEQIESQKRIYKSRLQLALSVMTASILLTTTIALNFISFDAFSLYNIVGIIVSIYAVVIVWMIMRRNSMIKEMERFATDHRDEELYIRQKLDDNETEVDRYRNLIATQSRELLIDFSD